MKETSSKELEEKKIVVSGVKQSDLEYRINCAHRAGANHLSTLTKFKKYLLELGLNRYEKLILPMETEESSSETWTGCYRGVKKDGNVVFPEWG